MPESGSSGATAAHIQVAESVGDLAAAATARRIEEPGRVAKDPATLVQGMPLGQCASLCPSGARRRKDAGTLGQRRADRGRHGSAMNSSHRLCTDGAASATSTSPGDGEGQVPANTRAGGRGRTARGL